MKKINYSLILFIIIQTVSCKKEFLDVPDKRLLLRQEYVKDLQTLNDYVRGTYATFATKFFHGYYMLYPDLIADNIKPITGSQILSLHYTWSQQADDDKESFGSKTKNLNKVWLEGCHIIRDCSFTIENADNYRSENPDVADNIKAQAHALRALTHFYLVNTFAQPYGWSAQADHPGIPYITSSNWTNSIRRSTVSEVYASMINDLTNAIELFKTGSLDARILNKNAANAILARVYLFMGDFSKSKELSIKVLTEVPLMAASPNGYPSKLFTPQETEALFQLTPANVNKGENFNTFFQGAYFRDPAQQFSATSDIVQILMEKPADVRRSWISSIGNGNYQITKYPKDVIPGFSIGTLSYYQTLIRSSEMYLTAAESCAKSGDENNARLYLDDIRKRADNSVASTIATGQALLDSIYKERRKELAFEGLRFFDLLRWKKSVNRIDVANGAQSVLPYPSPKAIAPIPLSDVTIAGLSQNESY